MGCGDIAAQRHPRAVRDRYRIAFRLTDFGDGFQHVAQIPQTDLLFGKQAQRGTGLGQCFERLTPLCHGHRLALKGHGFELRQLAVNRRKIAIERHGVELFDGGVNLTGLGQGIGTHYYNNIPNVLDKFLVSKGLVTGNSNLRAIIDSVEVVRLPEMVKSSPYPAPIRFGRKSSLNLNGFSDHYPIAVQLLED